MDDTYDGHPSTPGVDQQRLNGVQGPFSMLGLTMGVVVARYAVDDPHNRYRCGPEYDVRDIYNGTRYPSVRKLESLAGIVNGDDAPLHPASRQLAGGVASLRTPAAASDGDVVVLGFLHGSREQGIILGALPNFAVSYSASTADGERRFMTHAGTSVEIKATGDVVVVAKPGQKITVQTTGDDAVSIGGVDPSTHAALYEPLVASFNALVLVVNTLITLYNTHTHLPPGPPDFGAVVVASIDHDPAADLDPATQSAVVKVA